MLDEEWLRTLEFDSVAGRITGLAGVGSQYLVFNCTARNGDETVAKLPNTPHLGWSIREIPPGFSTNPTCDVDRLNGKLLRLVGNQQLDAMVKGYNDVYAAILKTLHGAMRASPDNPTNGFFDGFLAIAKSPTLSDCLAFILHTPGMRRRLEDLAFLDLKMSNPASVVVVNFIEDTREYLVGWARSILFFISQCSPPKGSDPEQLVQNPLYVWGGAVLDDFFSADEMPKAIAFMDQHFGRLSERPDAGLLRTQVFALLNLIGRFLSAAKVSRFTRFCALAGFSFNVMDSDGRVVARGADPDFTEDPPSVRVQKELDEAIAITKARGHHLRIPRLPDPSAIRAFPEEGHFDPFGQNPVFNANALLEVAKFAGIHAAIAHQNGIAVSLPQPCQAFPETYWKPWRSVLSIMPNDASSPIERQSETHNAEWEARIGLFGLELVQRCLVSRAAFPTNDSSDYWTQLAEAIENLGYLVISRSFDLHAFRQLNACYELGKFAALLHAEQCVHGDLHLDNFAFQEDGELRSAFDFGRATFLERPLTSLERACDLAVLKHNLEEINGFLQWEAAKLGYRSQAPLEIDEVLSHFDRSIQDGK